jgi:uncharacterized protein YndB with AHSA1/START domain
MEKSMIISEQIEFAADINCVWDLLTNPEMTKQYMFGCEVLSDWKTGSKVIWKGKTEDNTDIVFVKGEVTEINPGEMVSFTMFDPNRGMKDVPSNYVTLTYHLSPSQNGTLLSLTQGDFAGTQNAESRFEESSKGWEMLLPLMKNLLEEKVF